MGEVPGGAAILLEGEFAFVRWVWEMGIGL